MFGLSSLYVKLIGGLVAALVVLSLVADRGRWMHRAHGDEAQLALICTETRTASGIAKLDCKQVPLQIQFMGQAINTLTTALKRQSDAVQAQADADAKDKAAAVQAAKQSAPRANSAQGTSARLNASARGSARSSAPCEPSDALKGAWQ